MFWELTDEDGGGDDGGPEAFLVANGGLRDVLRSHDLVRELIDLFLFVPALVWIELESERRRQHLRGELFGVVAGDVFALAKAVVFGEVAVEIAITRNGD